MASVYRRADNDLSFDALRQRAWRESGRVSVNEQELVAALAARPELVDSWLAYSEDQRSNDAWYLACEPEAAQSSRWVVGKPSARTVLRFPDRIVACAAFVARTVGEPYVERTHHRHGS